MVMISKSSYTKIESDGRYVKKAGDEMTGTLIITPSGVNEALVIQKGKRLVLDGHNPSR